MTVLYRIHKLVEKDSTEINAAWKVSVILICTVSAIGAITSYISQGHLYEGFGSHCVLQSHLEFEEVPSGVASTHAYNYDNYYESVIEPELTQELEQVSDGNNTSSDSAKEHRIDIHRSQWGQDSLCQFCNYVPVMSVLFAIFWATMFAACPRGGRDRHGLAQPWRILPAALFFFCLLAIVSFLAASKLDKGIELFCKEFAQIINITRCSSAIDNYTIPFHDDGVQRAVYEWARFSVIGAWISASCWILGGALLLFRFLLLVDFELSVTTVISDNAEGGDAISTHREDTSSRRSLVKHHLRGGTAVTSV